LLGVAAVVFLLFFAIPLYDEFLIYQHGAWSIGKDYADAVDRAVLFGDAAAEVPAPDAPPERVCSLAEATAPSRPESYGNCFIVKATDHCGIGVQGRRDYVAPLIRKMKFENRICLVLATSADLWKNDEIGARIAYAIEHPCAFKVGVRDASYWGCGTRQFLIVRVKLVVVKDLLRPANALNFVTEEEFWPSAWDS
jgi:hypothetical protein